MRDAVRWGRCLRGREEELQSLKGSGYKANCFNVESGLGFGEKTARGTGTTHCTLESLQFDEDREIWDDHPRMPQNDT